MATMRNYINRAGHKVLTLNPPFHIKRWRLFRFSVLTLLDVMCISISYYFSFVLRLDTFFHPDYIDMFFITTPIFNVLHLIIFQFFGMYRQMWRYANIYSAMIVVRSVGVSSLVMLISFWYFRGEFSLPLSVPVIHFLLCSLILIVSRFSWRMISEYRLKVRSISKDRCLIYGAGAAADLLARNAALNPRFEMNIVGFVDDDVNKVGRFIQGKKVLGVGAELGALCSRENVRKVIIALPSASGKVIRSIVQKCRDVGVEPLIMPEFSSALGTQIIRPRSVDIADLLKRSPKDVSVEDLNRAIKGTTVLVTGGGGSIGSELCRQILTQEPQRLIILDSSEFNLYKLGAELEDFSHSADVQIIFKLGSILDSGMIQQTFSEFKPDHVFHAAAYKHVPLVESNPCQGVLNNVLGTRNIIGASINSSVKNFVLISSDKAVNPTNIMGMTKRVCELLVLCTHIRHGKQIRMAAVRFGNVLGSSGSVIPRFIEQIAQGGPVTVTHPDVTRYFMLTSEAVSLVLQAATMSKGGEIFVLNMGESVKIYDMACELIRLSGKEPGVDIEIEFVGLRPGEKLYEELILEGTESATTHNDIFVATSSNLPHQDIESQIERLLGFASLGNSSSCIALLRQLCFANYRSISKSSMDSLLN
jgi:FlaA1/EpsC-like NDP-sugar epimerase